MPSASGKWLLFLHVLAGFILIVIWCLSYVCNDGKAAYRAASSMFFLREARSAMPSGDEWWKAEIPQIKQLNSWTVLKKGTINPFLLLRFLQRLIKQPLAILTHLQAPQENAKKRQKQPQNWVNKCKSSRFATQKSPYMMQVIEMNGNWDDGGASSARMAGAGSQTSPDEE